jgi:hypothetical protein
VRKGKSQKPKEDPVPATQKGKEKVPKGPKKSKEHEKAPKIVKKLLADTQRIGAEQEAKAKKAAEKKVAEKKTVELKAAEKSTGKSKASQERPQLGKEPEGEPVKKKPRIEVARSTSNQLVRRLRAFPSLVDDHLRTLTSECRRGGCGSSSITRRSTNAP